MRKWFLMGVLLVVAAGFATADRATFDETRTQVAVPMSTPPVIDGVIDTDEWSRSTGVRNSSMECYWLLQYNDTAADFVRGGDNPSTSTSGPWGAEDFKIQIFTGYDADNLYVAVRVNDDTLCDDTAAPNSANESTWEDDSVEVFVDGDNSNYATRDTSGTLADIVATGGQYVITINNAYREAEAGNPGYGPDKAWYAQCTVTSDTSYDAEFRISRKTIGSPKDGDIIGFTIAVNDDDTFDTSVENQYTWIGSTHVESSYGNLVLGPRTYAAPKTKAPTLDGVVNKGEYGTAAEMVVNQFTGVYDLGAGDNDYLLGDHDYSAYITHDDTAVYVGISVTDDAVLTDTAEAGSEDGSTWEDDAMEIFFDVDNTLDIGHPSTVVGDGQYVLTPNGAHRDAEANNPNFGADQDWFGVATQTSKGYDIEFKVTKAILGNPKDGATMGFSVCNDDDDGAGRKAQLCWMGVAHNESSYGVLTLGTGQTLVTEWSLY